MKKSDQKAANDYMAILRLNPCQNLLYASIPLKYDYLPGHRPQRWEMRAPV